MDPNNGSQFWVHKLLELNSNTTMSYTEIICAIEDLEVCSIAQNEEINKLQIEFENKKAEYKYKSELRDVWRQLYEESKHREKRIDELIKVKKINSELAKQIYDLEKQKALEQEKQDKKDEKQLNEIYQKSMKIFESNPLVIKRNQLRQQVAKRKFDLLYINQKISNVRKVYTQLGKMEKLLEQKKIIKFAEVMTKYYKEQKKKNEALVNKQNTSINKAQEQSNDLKMNVEKPQEQIFVEPSKMPELSSFMNPINYDLHYNKNRERNESSLTNPITQKYQNIEFPKMNMNKYQLPFAMSNDLFNPKNYLTSNLATNSKSEQTTLEEPKQNTFNILNTSKFNLKLSSSPAAFKYNPEKQILEKESLSQIRETASVVKKKQKQELKRPSDTQETITEPKIAAISQNTQNVKFTSTELPKREERIFLSQPENKNFSQNEVKFISLSQGGQRIVASHSSEVPRLQKMTSKPGTISKINKIQTLTQNQIFNLRPTIEKTELFSLQENMDKKSETKETQKPNLTVQNKETLNQMSNLCRTTENTETVTAKNMSQNSFQEKRQPFAQLFNFQENMSRKSETKEIQKQYFPVQNKQTLNQMLHLRPTENTATVTTTNISLNSTQENKQPFDQLFTVQENVDRKSETKEVQEQHLPVQNKQILNPMFNLQSTVSTNMETPKTPKQKPVEKNVKTFNFKNPQPLETKSPYFVNQTITSSQEDQVTLNTSAEQSDQAMNVSQEQPSQISSGISGEYFDTASNPPLGIVEDVPMMNYPAYGVMDYYENNNDLMRDLGQNEYFSTAYTSPPGFLSPTVDENSTNKQQNNTGTSPVNNLFAPRQNSSNNIFNFNQTQSKTDGIFNMF